MSAMSELDIEANDAFYAWESSLGRTDLSDRDRAIWCEGYVEAKLILTKRATRGRVRATRGRVMMWLGSDIDYGGLVDLITEFANSEYTNDEFYQDVMDYDIEDEEDTDERDLKWLTSPN